MRVARFPPMMNHGSVNGSSLQNFSEKYELSRLAFAVKRSLLHMPKARRTRWSVLRKHIFFSLRKHSSRQGTTAPSCATYLLATTQEVFSTKLYKITICIIIDKIHRSRTNSPRQSSDFAFLGNNAFI